MTAPTLPRLSPGRRRVAELAAAGLTNQQIAARLWLTLSTVEQHLTATYRLCGIGRRRELAGALARLGEGGEPGV